MSVMTAKDIGYGYPKNIRVVLRTGMAGRRYIPYERTEAWTRTDIMRVLYVTVVLDELHTELTLDKYLGDRA